MDGDERFKCLKENAFIDISLCKIVTDGDKMVEIPHLPTEKFARTHDQFSFHNLSAYHEATHYIFGNLCIIHLLKRQILDLAVEELALREDRLHRIDLRACEYD